MKNKSTMVAFTVLAMLLMVGCSTGRDRDIMASYDNCPLVAAEGKNVEAAVITAATRRRWVPQKLEDGKIRCTIVQRNNEVVVDVLLKGDGYSIVCVKSNIPVRKYNQWVGNLQREIAKCVAQ